MTTCDPGTIVLIHFPFTDLSSTKRRPALIVSPASYAARFGDVVLLALTSQNQNDPLLALGQWRAAGLPKPTWIKPLIGTLSVGLVERQIGQIDPRDRPCVANAISTLLTTGWK
jgi:mRNA interferase MazF